MAQAMSLVISTGFACALIPAHVGDLIVGTAVSSVHPGSGWTVGDDRVFGAEPGRWTEVSPLHQLTAPPLPMLLVCSSRRGDSCAAARRFAAKAVSLGGRATVLPLDLGHGEINSELGHQVGYTASVDEFFRSLNLP